VTDTNQPSDYPSSPHQSPRNLIRSTLIAAGVALVLLVTVVLPAEYGVDPTRVGRLLGLTKMGEIKMSLAREAAIADSAEAALRSGAPGQGSQAAAPPAPASRVLAPGSTSSAPADSVSSGNSHVTEIVLRPAEGKEIKLVMRKDARVRYSWSTGSGVVNYDTHADAPGIKYHGYAKGTGKRSDEGVLVAAFDGAHGWFWRNRGKEAVTLTLRTSGDYQELKRM